MKTKAKKKSLAIRPLAIALPLCGSCVLSAAFLTEVAFRANITKYNDEGDPLIVLTYETWSLMTGLSIPQVRKAVARLKALGLLRAFSRPHGGKLKVLHVVLPKGVHNLFLSLTTGAYEYTQEGHLKMASFKYPVYMPGCSNSVGGAVTCVTDMTTPVDAISTDVDTAVCSTPDTPKSNNSEKKKDYDWKSLPKSDGIAAGSKKKVSMTMDTYASMGHPEGLLKVKFLPSLITQLRILYSHFHEQKEWWEKSDYLSQHELCGFWRSHMAAKYHDYKRVMLSGKERGLLGVLLGIEKPQLVQAVLEHSIYNWNRVMQEVEVDSYIELPNGPNITFVYRYFARIVNSETFRARDDFEMLTGLKKE